MKQQRIQKPQNKIRVVNQGELGEPPIINFGNGIYPDDLNIDLSTEDGRITNWAIERTGTIHGYFGEPLWYEITEDTLGEVAYLPIQAYGIWSITSPCSEPITTCGELDCRENGCCVKKRNNNERIQT